MGDESWKGDLVTISEGSMEEPSLGRRMYRFNGEQPAALEEENGGTEGRKLPQYHHTSQGDADIGIDFWGTDKEAYRLQWRIKNNHQRDDLSRIVQLNEVFRLGSSVSKDEWNAALGEVIDLDQWMRVLAMYRLSGIYDIYTQAPWNHNYLVYQRPGDNKLMMMPWDMDHAYREQTPLVGTSHHSTIRQIVQIPDNLRLLYGHLHNLISTTFNATYAQTWANHFNSMFPGTSFSGPASYIGSRAISVSGQLPSEVCLAATGWSVHQHVCLA